MRENVRSRKKVSGRWGREEGRGEKARREREDGEIQGGSDGEREKETKEERG